MFVIVELTNLNTNETTKTEVNNVLNRHCFQYIDSDGNMCEMCTYPEGICFFKQYEDHMLELHLRKNNYAKITTAEGEIKLDAKVVDFNENNDILVMRYVIDSEQRQIRVIYRS